MQDIKIFFIKSDGILLLYNTGGSVEHFAVHRHEGILTRRRQRRASGSASDRFATGCVDLCFWKLQKFGVHSRIMQLIYLIY